MVGMALGVMRMIADFIYRAPECGVMDERPSVIKDFHYLYYAFVVFAVSGLTAVIVSLSTAKLPSYRVSTSA